MFSLLFVLATLMAQTPPATAPAEAPPAAGLPFALPIPDGAAAIDTSASSNTAGSRIVVMRDGGVSYALGSETGMRTVSTATAAQFFRDLAALTPFPPRTAAGACMHSASFGTTTTVVWEGKRTPPLGCPPGGVYADLVRDIGAIRGELQLSTFRMRRPIEPLVPRPAPSQNG